VTSPLPHLLTIVPRFQLFLERKLHFSTLAIKKIVLGKIKNVTSQGRVRARVKPIRHIGARGPEIYKKVSHII